jgi:glycosyltransferase involved in cell wall biosynthesis
MHLFGDGPERESLERFALRELPGIPVEFHGTVVDRERIYRAIDVLAVGSRTEGQSMAIMEAMSRGVPVIATGVGGNTELVQHGQTGMVVAPGDPLATRDAIVQLLAEPELVHRLGDASHALIAARHSIDAVVAKYHALYVPSS